MKKLGDNAFINDPGDDADAARKKLELEKKLDPRKHQYLSMIFGGQRIEVPLGDFVAKHGDPTQYSKEDLKKYVLNTWMKKNLG